MELLGILGIVGALMWAIGMPITLMIDAYVQGRYTKSIFPSDDDVDKLAAALFWPIYFPLATIAIVSWPVFEKILDSIENLCEYSEKKGKQANDLDYQAEKYLLGKKDD